MALSPMGFIRSAGRAALAALDTGYREMPIAPLREASPEDDDAPPSIGSMVSRSGEATFIPDAYLNRVTPNDDPTIAKDGNGLKLYEALLSDDTVFSTLQQRRLAITSRDFTVGPGDKDDPLSVRAADDFRAMLDALPFDDATGGLHYAVMFGYAVGEGLFEVREHDGRQIIWLTDIVVPDRRHFGFTLTGELRFTGTLGIPGTSNGFGPDGEVPPNKFVTIRTGGTHDFAFYGLGLGHWLYWLVFFKRAAIKHWALYLEKRANPTTAIEFTDAQKDNQKAKDDLLAAAIAVGKDSAVLLPEGTIAGEHIKILEGASKSGGSSDYKDFIADQNEAIMRVVLGQPGTSKATPGGLGGDGQAKKDEGVKREIVKADSDLISGAINRTFAKWVTLWNYGPDVKPPKVWRELDDAEDLNTVAKRDVDLNGIGIKRTEESVAEVYGDGYILERETPEEKLARETALIAAKQGAAPPAGGNVVDLAAERKRRVTEFMAEFGIEDEIPLYVSRKLLNGAALAKWAADNGLTPTVPASDMHVTILYSKTPVDPFKMGETWIDQDGKGGLIVKGGPRALKRFDGGAIVLRFASSDLNYRHESMIERGASSDYPEYKPHVTLSYDVPADFDISTIKPFDGELRFGPELFEPLRLDPQFDASTFNFAAADEDAIDRLVTALIDETNPVFAAMASELKASLQGVTTVEAARIAIVEAAERFPIDRLARLTALPMLAARAGAVVGAEDQVSA